MGMAFKAHDKSLKYGEKNFGVSYWTFGALREFSKVLDTEYRVDEFFTACPARWSAEDVKAIAKVLGGVTLKQTAAFKKLSRDKAVTSPILTCEKCEGQGTTELDDSGMPQYIDFCKHCRGLGVVRNTYDIGESIRLDEIHSLAKFLEKSGGVSVS